LPLLTVFVAPHAWLVPSVAIVSMIVFVVLGAVAARTGGANMASGAVRVLIWGTLAMAVTASLGKLFGALA
jgi:VIT1/CCC1 family predicted Fe2+/Mn2+ transporter